MSILHAVVLLAAPHRREAHSPGAYQPVSPLLLHFSSSNPNLVPPHCPRQEDLFQATAEARAVRAGTKNLPSTGTRWCWRGLGRILATLPGGGGLLLRESLRLLLALRHRTHGADVLRYATRHRRWRRRVLRHRHLRRSGRRADRAPSGGVGRLRRARPKRLRH
jgi:hypothetical protein